MTKKKSKTKHTALSTTLPDILTRGIQAHNAGELNEAIKDYEQILKINPKHIDALHLYGLACYQQGEFKKALELVKRSITINDAIANIYNTYASILLALNNQDEAIVALKRAVHLDPYHYLAWNNLGNTQRDKGEYAAAKIAYDAALKLNPYDPETLTLSCFIRQHLCDWEELDSLRHRFMTLVPQPEHQRIAPFTVLSLVADPIIQKKWASHFAAETASGLSRQKTTNDHHQQSVRQKIHIGYVSSDFFNHATSFLLAEVIELHDREQFKIVGYSIGPSIQDEMHQRIKSAFDEFSDLSGSSVQNIATKIKNDHIDILIDLKGYTTGARPGIFCLKPAPIQISWLGYPGTLGMTSMDYIISDSIITPPEYEIHFTEKIIRLPDTYQCNDRKRIIAKIPQRSEANLPEGAFVFCAFNNAYKITPDIFSIWMRLLHKTPNSVLWLLDTHQETKNNLQKTAETSGINPSRLVFAQKLPQPEHLARIKLADLFLDTYPVNAHTTASDALWAGLPLVTLCGTSFVSRVATSLLHAAGLPQLSTRTLEEYERLCENLVHNPETLHNIRTYLHKQRLQLNLFNTPKFTQNLEYAYTEAWKRHLNGIKPESFNIKTKKVLHIYSEGNAKPYAYAIPFNGFNHQIPRLSALYPHSFFDHVLITHILEKIDNITQFIAACWEVLAPSGNLDLVVAHDLSHYAWSHPLNQRTFNHTSLQYIIKTLPDYLQNQIAATSFQLHLSLDGEKLKNTGCPLDTILQTARAIDKITFSITKNNIIN